MVNYIYDQIFESSSKILRIYENMNFRNIDDIKLNTALKKSYDSVLKYDKNFKNLKLSQVEVDYIKAVFDEKYINAFSNEVFFNYKLRMIIRYTFQSFEFSFFNLINEYNTIFFIETTPDPILNNYYVKSNFFEKTIIKIEDIFNINKTVWMNKDKPFKQFFNFQKISFELKKQIEFFYETNKFYTDNAILTKIEAWIMKNTILYECFDDLYVFLSDDLELNDVFICIGYQISRLNSLFYDYYKKIESDQKNPKKFNLKEIELSLKTKNLTAMQIISTKIRSIFSSNLTKLFTNEKLQSYDNDIKESFFEKFQSDAFIILNHFNLFKNTKLSKRIPNKSLGIYEGNLASYCKKNNSQFNLIETQQKKILNDFSYKLNKLDEINNKNKSIKTSDDLMHDKTCLLNKQKTLFDGFEILIKKEKEIQNVIEPIKEKNESNIILLNENSDVSGNDDYTEMNSPVGIIGEFNFRLSNEMSAEDIKKETKNTKPVIENDIYKSNFPSTKKEDKQYYTKSVENCSKTIDKTSLRDASNYFIQHEVKVISNSKSVDWAKFLFKIDHSGKCLLRSRSSCNENNRVIMRNPNEQGTNQQRNQNRRTFIMADTDYTKLDCPILITKNSQKEIPIYSQIIKTKEPDYVNTEVIENPFKKLSKTKKLPGFMEPETVRNLNVDEPDYLPMHGKKPKSKL